MFNHIPVLLKESIEGLNINKDGIYVDATLGGGGHSEGILKKIEKGKGKLISIDQDIDAINSASEKLKKYITNNKLTIVKNNFENIDLVLDENNIDTIDGIIFDLGVSSFQFDEGNRGFSYNYDAKLDMRMDKDNSLTCEELVNEYSESEIYKIIRDYGEDNFAKNISKHICEYRKNKHIESTFELVNIIKASIPAAVRNGKDKKNPAKKTFQAFRICINREFEVIEKALDKVIYRLNDTGRLLVITFHSLEDKLVKDKFKFFENPCTCPKGYPCICGKKSLGKLINKHVIVPSEEEIEANRRAHSAKLRIFERKYD